MGLQYAARFQYSPLALESSLKVCSISGGDLSLSKRPFVQFVRREGRFCLSSSKHLAISLPRCDFRRWRCGIGRNEDQVKSGDGDGLMDEDERREWRKKIWDVIDKYPNVQEELDPEEKRRKMEKLLAEYPLVVEEEDPDWPEDADGRGFGLDQFFNKISIKNCVAIDAVVDCDLVSALKVSNFPELIFTKSGKILYREKAIRPADELSKIMAYFYYGAAKPPFFNVMENIDEAVPSAPISNES
uniref:Uncharacterized protein n=1 Tax=Chenopodium quinoa TaxID=63459 RepID=A0A803KTY1_CHEQI